MHPAALANDEELVRGRRMLGDFELTVCTDGPYVLDGGAMFGVVPKTLWSKRMTPDADNNVLLGLNTVIVRTGKAVVVIETGIGNKEPPKMKAIHQVKERLPQAFRAAGISKNDVTHVINTHLHFDHCGWNTILQDDGSVIPTFPHARYFFAAGELAHARLQLERDRMSYLAPNFDPLIASGQVTVIDPGGSYGYEPDDERLRNPEAPHLPPVNVQHELEIVPGISVEPLPGHTASQLGVHIESRSEHACYPGDLFPTRHHLDPTWVMGYDLDPLTCIAERKRFLKRAMGEDWLVLFTHDHDVPMGRLGTNEKGKPVVAEEL